MHPHRHRRWLAATGHATDTATYVTPHRNGAQVPARPTRGRFETDYQRVETSEQLARLAGVKQAFLLPTPGSGVSTRLSHSRSVAAIAATIATAAGLNDDLARTGGLAHDCGHAPGGHAGEDALAFYAPGGFDHAPYGADVTLAGLGLSDEVLDAVRNHSWSRPSPSTPEGQVVGAADRIAYATDDLTDAARLGLITDLAALVGPDVVRLLGPDPTSWRIALIADVVTTIRTHGVVGFSPAAVGALTELRHACNATIYSRPASVLENAAMVHVVRYVVDHEVAAGRAPAQAMAWVTAMTDQQVIDQAIGRGLDPWHAPLTTAETTGPSATYPVPALDPHTSPEGAAALCAALRQRGPQPPCPLTGLLGPGGSIAGAE
jgi:dGTPase